MGLSRSECLRRIKANESWPSFHYGLQQLADVAEAADAQLMLELMEAAEPLVRRDAARVLVRVASTSEQQRFADTDGRVEEYGVLALGRRALWRMAAEPNPIQEAVDAVALLSDPEARQLVLALIQSSASDVVAVAAVACQRSPSAERDFALITRLSNIQDGAIQIEIFHALGASGSEQGAACLEQYLREHAQLRSSAELVAAAHLFKMAPEVAARLIEELSVQRDTSMFRALTGAESPDSFAS